jgi:hypothetical protein
VAKKVHKSASQIVRDVIVEYIESVELKEREAKAREEREREEKRERRRGRLGALAPEKRDLSPNLDRLVEDETLDDDDDDLNTLYILHAKKIEEAVSNPIECRLRAQEAVRAIERQRPLTNPGAAEILKRLEAEIRKLRTRSATPEDVFSRTVDNLLGREVDPKKTKTRILGDIPDPENNE